MTPSDAMIPSSAMTQSSAMTESRPMNQSRPLTGAALEQRVADLAAWFESLTPASLAGLEQWYAPDARFKDPFNDVRGSTAIRGVFEHMFRKLDAPRFVVSERLFGSSAASLCWTFHFRFKGEAVERVIDGTSLLHFNAAGLVEVHRDYWDAAEELYEKLPVIGAFMRWLGRRARSG